MIDALRPEAVSTNDSDLLAVGLDRFSVALDASRWLLLKAPDALHAHPSGRRRTCTLHGRAAREVGYRGFFMGYFAMRAAPLGAVGPRIVTASFFGFHPSRVERALPDAWGYAGPERALEARLAGVDRVLNRVWDLPAERARIEQAADLVWRAAQAAGVAGRVLAAANQALPRPDPAHLALWQAATVLREHRGDGHVAVLLAEGVGPVEAMVLKSAAGEADGTALRAGRGWREEDWLVAEEALRTQGWLGSEGALTAAGRRAHRAIENRTDAAAASPWQHLGDRGAAEVISLLEPLVTQLVAAGTVPTLNPIGLPLPERGTLAH